MKKLFKVPVRFIWVLGALIILQACYPGGSIPIADLDTVSTLYNTDDLATAPTSAALVWDVVNVEVGDGDDLPYDGESDDDILNTTLAELVALYGEGNVKIISETANPVPPPANANVEVIVPDVDPLPSVSVLIAPSVVLRNKTVAIVYPGYPWWGGGGWWGGYPGYPGGCYYCGYPSVGYSTYEVGSIVLEMYDLRNLPPAGPVPGDYDMSWLAVIRGLISSHPESNSARIIESIQRAFAQSPYLK